MGYYSNECEFLGETWLEIPSLNGDYQASDYGRIRKRRTKHILSQKTNSKGYVCHHLYYNGKRVVKKAHRLVAESFIVNPENKPFINHKNSIRNDNRISNLEWCTNNENVSHAKAAGRLKGCGHKKIDQILPDGRIITHNSIGDAAISIGVSRGLIDRVLARRGYHKTARGSKLKYHV